MIQRKKTRKIECVLIDVNTQKDFFERRGAMPVANARAMIPALRKIVAWSKRNGAPVISSLESNRPIELSDSGTPICCVDGSGGQCKMDFTIFPKRTNFELDTTLALPVNPFRQVQQVIFRKRGNDLLLNPKADRLFTYLPVKEYIIYGAGLETAVKSIVLSLLTREQKVSIIVDACGYWHKRQAQLAIRQLNAKGADLITVEDLLSRKLNERYRARYRKNRATIASHHQPHTLYAQGVNGRSDTDHDHHDQNRHDPDHNGHIPVRKSSL